DLEAEIGVREREYNDLEEVWEAEKATLQGATKGKEQIEAAKLELESAQRRQDYARMSEIQYGKLPELEKQLKAAQEAETKGFTLLQDKVTAEEIAEVVSRWTGIPVSKMLEGEREKLLEMEEQLHTRVVGQEEAILSEIQYGKLPELEKQLKAAQEAETKGFTLLQDKVTAEEIAEVVSRWTGIPVSKMLEGEREKLLKMEEQLHTRVVGQEEAIKV